MAVGTIHYVRELLSAFVYPADMPLPVVRSPLRLPLGDRGLLPLPDALPGVGAGVVPGGSYTVPKGCWIPIPGRPAGRGQGLFLPYIPPHILAHIAGRGVVVGPPRACPGLGAGRSTGALASYPSLTHAHTRHTRPGPAVLLKPLSGGLHGSGCLAAGRRCGALQARRTGAASLRDGQGQGALWGRGGSRERS